MTELCTWPEASYALALTRTSTWPGQRAALSVICAFAHAQGVIAGYCECSDRDLAANLHAGRVSVNSAARLLDGLVAHRVFERIELGAGSAPSVYRLEHWTRWVVPWRFRWPTVVDRVTAFVAAETRAPAIPGARVVQVRAPAKSARILTRDLVDVDEAGARALRDARAGETPAREDEQVDASQRARQRAAFSFSTRDRDLSPSERGSEGGKALQRSNRARLLVAAVEASTNGSAWGQPRKDLEDIADRANGSWEAIYRAATRAGPKTIVGRVMQLRELLELLDEAPPEAAPPAPRPEVGPELTPETIEANRARLRAMRSPSA